MQGRGRSTVDRYSFIAGMAVGAALTFILDPASGRRRRALVRDQFVHAGHKTRRIAEGTAKDLSNRARGVVAETRSMFAKPADAAAPGF